jgi:serine/threonine-protein kinase
VLKGGYGARYLPTGHLLYANQGTLFGVRFDPDHLEVRGTPLPLLEKDTIASQPIYGAGQFDFSRNGTFLYLSTRDRQALRLMWLDQAGKTEPLVPEPGFYITPRFSPDGRRLAVDGFAAAVSDIWTYDLQRHAPQRLTFTSNNFFPVWTPDGKHLVYSSQGSTLAIWWIRADGGGEAARLYESKNLVRAHSFSLDGRRLAFSETGVDTGGDLWTLPLDTTDPEHPKSGKPELFLGTPANEVYPSISPDSRWMAYQSNESGEDQIHVRPFPGPGGHWQVSTSGGQSPVWSRNGHELFFESLDNRVMVAEYTVRGNSFEAGSHD